MFHRLLYTSSCHCVTATVSGLAFSLCRHFWNHETPQLNLVALANGLSQNFSVNGRKSISCVQALLSCLCSCQYVSAIASGLMNELCSLSGIMPFVRGASMIPSMMMWATWMPCKKFCAPQCVAPLLQNALWQGSIRAASRYTCFAHLLLESDWSSRGNSG